MPFKVNIDPDANLVVSVWDGLVTGQQLTDYIDQVWIDPAIRGFNELIDFRQIADVDLPSSSIQSFADYSRQYDNPDTPARSAVVAESALVFGLSRMFSTIRSLEPTDSREFRVFEDLEQALSWIDAL